MYSRALSGKDCYPVFYDGVQTKEDFQKKVYRHFVEENYILLKWNGGGQPSWISFYYLKEDKYLQLYFFLVTEQEEEVLKAFLEYLEKYFGNYHYYFGFSKEHKAVSILKRYGFSAIEESVHGIFRMEDVVLKEETGGVIRIHQENYGSFQRLHDQYSGQAYWNSERIYDDLNNWNIYYLDDMAVYLSGNEIKEVFGVDGIFKEDVFRTLLTCVLNDLKKEKTKSLIFFHEKELSHLLKESGCIIIDNYICLEK